MKQLLSFIFILSFATLVSQNTEIIDGVEYLTHKVKKKETLYGISKEYNVTIEEIKIANNGLSEGLKKGSFIKVPTGKKIETNTSLIAEDQYMHIVKQGEGAYGIARQYGVSVEDLVKANPGKTQNMKPGDELVIPGKNKANNNSHNINTERVITHIVKEGETIYGLSKKYGTTIEEITEMNQEVSDAGLKKGDKLNIRTKVMLMKPFDVQVKNNPKVDFNHVHKIDPLKEKLEKMIMKDAYNVTALLPFMFYKNAQVQKNRKPNEPKRMYQLTEMSTHFYQGMKIALDTLRLAGVSINVNIYDTRKDTGYVNKLLAAEEVKSSDLIIGPFYEKTFKKVTEFAKQNKIQLACPVEQSNKVLFNNPYVTKLKASLPTQAAFLAKYIAENHNIDNVVLVAGKSKKDKYLADLFEKIYNDSIKGKTNNYNQVVTRYNFASYKDMGGLGGKLSGSKKNIIIFPSTELGLSTSFFTQFNVVMNKPGMHKHEVEIYALENFRSYDDIEVDHKVKYNLHITSSYFVDYNSDEVLSFIKKYRDKFGTDPNDFAFMGYDVMLYHGMALKNFGKSHADFYDYVQLPLLQTKYDLKQKEKESGYENQQVFILSYSDYELNRIN